MGKTKGGLRQTHLHLGGGGHESTIQEQPEVTSSQKSSPRNLGTVFRPTRALFYFIPVNMIVVALAPTNVP